MNKTDIDYIYLGPAEEIPKKRRQDTIRLTRRIWADGTAVLLKTGIYHRQYVKSSKHETQADCSEIKWDAYLDLNSIKA
jgi:hypothetical protein